MKIIFNPFEKFSTNTQLIFGILISVAGCFLAYQFNAHYDGALDIHFADAVPLHIPFLEIVLDTACLGLALFVAAKTINPKTRSIDIFSTVLVARFPLYLIPPMNYNNRMYEETMAITEMAMRNQTNFAIPDMAFFLAFSALSLLLLVWFFVLLWNGYKVACNAKGTTAVLAFIGAIIIAEIISKILIIYTFPL
ncbi:hypothetical protein [Flavobacterium sp.]|uniref:hypothetical protein n=1 Tax=Flavobacterium sp. TaxID=239 RepID=UPI0026019F57|nr:hypothetical protein [Flavobacterium sp.]